MFQRRLEGETRNTEIEDVPAKIGGRNAVRVAPGRFSTLSDINTITAMKRECLMACRLHPVGNPKRKV
jgi:hypothetical protein